MKLSDVTSLGRTPLDPSYSTNWAIALLTAVVAIVSTIVQLLTSMGLLESILWGVGAGLSVFLAWALARELDPEHDLSAFVAVALMLAGLWIYGLPELLPLLWMLVTLRLVNRVVGPPAKISDSLLELGLGGWLAWQGQWIFGLITGLAFLLDGLLPVPLRRQLAFAALALIVTAVAILAGGTPTRSTIPALSLPSMAAVALTSLLFLVVILDSRHVQAVTDTTQHPLMPIRVQAGQVLALMTGILAAWWQGTRGVAPFLPLWAGMAGTGLYRIFLLLLQVRPTDAAIKGK
jgi:hypothetical protein